jgi:uncharacterized protein (TIGR01777 family)
VRVFVTGATGLIGRALCAALVARGDTVVGLSRSASRSRSGSLGSGSLAFVTGDPSVPGPWQDELARADACVHLAGEPIAAGRLTPERKRRVRESRVHGTLNVAAVLRERGPRVLVSGSAVGFYGSRGDEVLDESAAPGEGFLAEVTRAWEDASRPAEERARVVLLRTGIVLAAEGGALPKLARPFRLFAGGPLGDGAFFQPWIHLADEVGLVLFALGDERVRGPLNAAAPEPARNRDLAAALGRVLHRPSALPAPAFAMRLALGELADVVLASQRVVPRKALELGFRFRFPVLEPALRDLLVG